MRRTDFVAPGRGDFQRVVLCLTATLADGNLAGRRSTVRCSGYASASHEEQQELDAQHDDDEQLELPSEAPVSGSCTESRIEVTTSSSSSRSSKVSRLSVIRSSRMGERGGRR
jgi:hypothetical protein